MRIQKCSKICGGEKKAIAEFLKVIVDYLSQKKLENTTVELASEICPPQILPPLLHYWIRLWSWEFS